MAEGVTVVAESDGSYEEAVTDASGQYRLRGLAPNTRYTVRVKVGLLTLYNMPLTIWVVWCRFRVVIRVETGQALLQ